VQGVGNLLVQLARCCQPVAGEPIVGYITQGRGVTVHRADCASFRRMAATHPERVLPVEWGQAGGGYEVDVQITAADRKWLLKDITNLIAQADVYVLDIHSEALRDSGRAFSPRCAAGGRLRPAVDAAGQARRLARRRRSRAAGVRHGRLRGTAERRRAAPGRER
jgi:hypothetical protein